MSNKHRLIILMIWGWYMAGFLSGISQSAEQTQVVTKDYVESLIPKGPDAMGDISRTKRQALISLGITAHPVLVEIISESEDPIWLSRCFSVMAETPSVRTYLDQAIDDALSRFGGKSDRDASIQMTVLRTLRKVGDPGDVSRILPLLNSDHEGVRLVAIQTLSTIGGPEATKAISNILDRQVEIYPQQDGREQAFVLAASNALVVLQEHLEVQEEQVIKQRKTPYIVFAIVLVGLFFGLFFSRKIFLRRVE